MVAQAFVLTSAMAAAVMAGPMDTPTVFGCGTPQPAEQDLNFRYSVASKRDVGRRQNQDRPAGNSSSIEMPINFIVCCPGGKCQQSEAQLDLQMAAMNTQLKDSNSILSLVRTGKARQLQGNCENLSIQDNPGGGSGPRGSPEWMQAINEQREGGMGVMQVLIVGKQQGATKGICMLPTPNVGVVPNNDGCAIDGSSLPQETDGSVAGRVKRLVGRASSESVDTRILMHELGHGLGLPHVFNDGMASRNLKRQNGPPRCANNDHFTDTKPQAGPTAGCPDEDGGRFTPGGPGGQGGGIFTGGLFGRGLGSLFGRQANGTVANGTIAGELTGQDGTGEKVDAGDGEKAGGCVKGANQHNIMDYSTCRKKGFTPEQVKHMEGVARFRLGQEDRIPEFTVQVSLESDQTESPAGSKPPPPSGGTQTGQGPRVPGQSPPSGGTRSPGQPPKVPGQGAGPQGPKAGPQGPDKGLQGPKPGPRLSGPKPGPRLSGPKPGPRLSGPKPGPRLSGPNEGNVGGGVQKPPPTILPPNAVPQPGTSNAGPKSSGSRGSSGPKSDGPQGSSGPRDSSGPPPVSDGGASLVPPKRGSIAPQSIPQRV